MKELNKIYCGDACELVPLLEINPDLFILSPPDQSETNFTFEEYTDFLHNIYKKCADKLKDGGVLASITTDRKHKGKIYTKHIEIIKSLEGKLNLFDYKIWAKSLKTNLYILNYCHMLFFKKGDKVKVNHRLGEFLPDVWLIERDKVVGYKTKDSFPTELVGRIIKNFTNEKEIVVDPFIGSGKTGKVSINLNRNYIGFDIDPGIVDLANNYIKN